MFIGSKENKTIVTDCREIFIPGWIFKKNKMNTKLDLYDKTRFKDEEYIKSIMELENKHWIEILKFNYNEENGKYLTIDKDGSLNISKHWTNEYDLDLNLLLD